MLLLGEPQFVQQLVQIENGTDEDVRRLVDKALGGATPEELNPLAAAVGSRLKTFAPTLQHYAAAHPDTETIQSAGQLVMEAIGDVMKNAGYTRSSSAYLISLITRVLATRRRTRTMRRRGRSWPPRSRSTTRPCSCSGCAPSLYAYLSVSLMPV